MNWVEKIGAKYKITGENLRIEDVRRNLIFLACRRFHVDAESMIEWRPETT